MPGKRLAIGIESSSSDYRVVIGHSGLVLFDSRGVMTDDPRDLALLLSDGLASLSADVGDIELVAVDIGPGGLGSIRSGVTFANALAFARGIPVFPCNAFEIVGAEARKQTALPVLYVVTASAGNAYVGLYEDDAVKMTRFGSLPNVAAEVTASLTEFAIAGRKREEIRHVLPHCKLVDTGIATPDAGILLELTKAVSQPRRLVGQANPLNEQARIFYE